MIKFIYKTQTFLFCLAASLNVNAFDSDMVIQHTSLEYVNNGVCSSAFEYKVFDFMDAVSRIEFTVIAKEPKGNIEKAETLISYAKDFNMVGGKTYGTIYFEGEDVCKSDNWVISIPKVLVVFEDGTPAYDFVKSKKITVEKFKPYKIIIGK